MSGARRLAAILAADVVGSSRLIEADEANALSSIRGVLAQIGAASIHHGGRVFKTMGDGVLVEFASPVAALTCATELQRVLGTAAEAQSPKSRVLLRIGVNLGDVVATTEGDLYGDGVNVAARLEAMAEPGGIAVSGKVHDELKGRLTLPFVDLGEIALKNISRPVRVWALAGSNLANVTEPERPHLPLPDKPSIAVLPFTNMSGDPEQEYFADGVVEDIITALSRVKWFFVIARNSSFTYKGKPVDIRQVGRELGVRYVLEGSIRRVQNRVRITGQLIEAESGRHVWADRFDGDLTDIFELQDEVARSVAAAVEPSLRLAESERLAAKPTESLLAYELCLRAVPDFHHLHLSKARNDEAVALLRRAVQVDPSYTQAMAWMAWVQMVRKAQYWSTPDDEQEGTLFAERALADHRDDPLTLACSGQALAYLKHDYDRAVFAVKRALTLHPDLLRALLCNGWVRMYVGEPTAALESFERAIRLNPIAPDHSITLSGMGIAHWVAGDCEGAVRLGKRAIEEAPTFVAGYRALILGHVGLGDIEAARGVAKTYVQISPEFRLSTFSRTLAFREPSLRDRYLASLRAAGLPE